jgi:2-succinyl-6-hydroxy-2,4-cyclohexadiene-1-carboxylate synthase
MLIALHGFTETDESWHEVLAPVIAGVRCPLLPGHGHLPCPPDTTLSSAAATVLRGVTAERPVDILGYSMGGRVALQAALDQPQLVRRLVLVACRPGIEDPGEREARRRHDELLAEMLVEDGIGPFVVWWEDQPALRPVTRQPPAVVTAVRARRLGQDPDGLAASLRCLGQGRMQPLWHRLGELRMPVLLVVGAGDRGYCDAMTRMQAAIPGARLVVIPEAGHAVHREQSASLLAAIRPFLES